jgi:hypothetical protein
MHLTRVDSPARPAAARRLPAGGRASRPFRALAVVVVAGSVVIRGALEGRQSYWIDELFSVSASSGGFATMLHRSATEVHTPLYATLLWAWIRIGGTGEAWTRTLSTVCAVAAIVVAHRGLRGTGLSDWLRWALTAATAAGGTSLVYSLETRNYALLALGATGLTVTTLRVALAIRARAIGSVRAVGARRTAGSRRDRLTWFAWSALTATAHLLGAVLVLACAAALVAVTIAPVATQRRVGPRGGRGVPSRGSRVRQALGWVLLAAAGCAGQAAWLIAGLHRPGFASGTAWIGVPGAGSVRDLVTTTFASGGLSVHRDGFAWTSTAGALGVLTGCAVAAGWGWFARRDAPGDGAGGGASWDGGGSWDAEAVAAVVLLGITTLVVAGVFAVARWQHIWTLRNMSVVAPALSWGAICLASALARTRRARRVVAVGAVALLGAGLVPIGVGLARPYKTDFRGLFAYLSTVRAEHPDAALVFVGNGPPLGWGPVDAPLRATPRAAGTAVGPVAVRSAAAVHRTAGTEVVVIYRGVADPDPSLAAQQLAARLDHLACHPVSLFGLGVVRCG